MLKRWVLPIILIFALGLGIRLYDLTDPPFDFHPTRQLRSALIARGMYYAALDDAPGWQRATAVAQWQREAVIEPPVMERLSAGVYRLLGTEALWVPRLLSSLFWMLGAGAILLLGREAGAAGAGVLAAVYFVFLPYGMIASRAFQPDPLMAALMAGALWAAVRWDDRRTMKSALLAGALAGAAIFVKTVAIFMLGGALAGLVLCRESKIEDRKSIFDLRSSIRDKQVWLVAALALLPTAFYYIYGLWIDGFLRQQLGFRFFPEMWRDPAFYIRWVEMATGIAGFLVVLAGLAGVFLWRERAQRGMAAGMWIGYALYSLTFPYHTITHDYYQLPLIPLAAISLIPLGALILEGAARLDGRRWATAALISVVGFGVLFKVWDARVILAREDFRDAETEWGVYREIIPAGASVMALTKTYGYPLAYYGWVNADIWLGGNDEELRILAGQSAEEFAARQYAGLEGKDLFLITNLGAYDEQPELKAYLTGNFAVFAEGDGYLIFDLNAPK
jgi:4-amino-4-deoxy-L-arabinose transferase-like glycosyltransferase